MKSCSLCGEELQPDGGAVLFADARGIPFEVCGACEGKIDLLRNADNPDDTGAALRYISERAGTLENGAAYDSLMEFLRNADAPEPEPEFGEARLPLEDLGSEDTEGKRKAGKTKTVLIVAVLAAVLLIAYAMGAFAIH